MTRDHSAARESAVPQGTTEGQPCADSPPQPPPRLKDHVSPLPQPPLPAGDNRGVEMLTWAGGLRSCRCAADLWVQAVWLSSGQAPRI